MSDTKNKSDIRIRWPEYWSFSVSISLFNEYSGLISFRIDWFDLLAVQGTLRSLFQHHNSKASILQHSAIFIVQLSHTYTTTGKTIALTTRTLSAVMSLLFSTLSGCHSFPSKEQVSFSFMAAVTICRGQAYYKFSVSWTSFLRKNTTHRMFVSPWCSSLFETS